MLQSERAEILAYMKDQNSLICHSCQLIVHLLLSPATVTAITAATFDRTHTIPHPYEKP